MDVQKIFQDFKFTDTRELLHTYVVTKGDDTYRIELLYSYSNPTTPWFAEVYVLKAETWKLAKEFPWVQEGHEEGALRQALSFIQDQKAN